MRTVLTSALLLVLGTSQAWAGIGATKTMRQPLPSQEVERSVNIPKGWLEFGFGYHHKVATGSWGADGTAHEFDSARWTLDTYRLDVRYGLTNKVEIWWAMPLLSGHLTNDVLGTDTRDRSLGDLLFGYRLLLMHGEAPTSDLALELEFKGPSSQEAPGSYIGGPLNVASFVFTTGTPDVALGLAWRQQFGFMSVTARAGYVKRFSGVVQYLVELNEYQFSGRIKPGDKVYGDLDLLVQLGPVALVASPEFTWRNTTRIGTTAPGLTPASRTNPVVGSDGYNLDLDVQGLVNITRGFDAGVGVTLPLAGEDLQFFPIEDLHPTRGVTISGSFELRY